tara:strand:- start:165 stop:365 length:201 start_codon:yes stop_codon:yes gene_type:complete
MYTKPSHIAFCASVSPSPSFPMMNAVLPSKGRSSIATASSMISTPIIFFTRCGGAVSPSRAAWSDG